MPDVSISFSDVAFLAILVTVWFPASRVTRGIEGAVWAMLACIGILLLYGTFFRDAQPWLLTTLAVIGLCFLALLALRVFVRRRRHQVRVLPPPR